ncbi:MAG: Stp1/IreP family PP2C-type Ser/Thr phosphatase [Longibaculum sp.]
MQIIAMSDMGNVRVINQDYVRYHQKNDQECLVVLCDGMGGHNAGEIASQMTCDDIIEHYINHGDFHDENEIQTWMSEIVNHAHQLVKKKSYESKELEGMGTTVVLALLKDDDIYISHVGDSRAYLFDYENFTQLTKDDTLVNVLVDSGTISKDEAMYLPQKNILLQAVGVSDVLKISFVKQRFEKGLLLVCSDGLYNSLFDSQLIEILQKNLSLEDKGKELMDNANTFGGKDNIGFALILKEGVVNNESNK